INLKIAGKSNIPITNEGNIFNMGISELIPKNLYTYKTLIIIIICTIIIKKILDWYLQTKSGLLLRATGDNPGMITLLARNHGYMKIIGLMLCNGLAAISGSILAQQQRYFDSTMGTGMLVMGLSSVIIGRSIFKKCRFIKGTTMVLMG